MKDKNNKNKNSVNNEKNDKTHKKSNNWHKNKKKSTKKMIRIMTIRRSIISIRTMTFIKE